MANIPIREMAQSGTPSASSQIVFDDGTMKRGTVASMADAVRPVASQAEAEAGSDNAKIMSPLRVKQSIASEVGVSVASKSQGDLANSSLQPGGPLGTPSSATLTNATGLPTAGLLNSAVTNAKMANMADGTIKANVSGSSGTPGDVSISGVLDKLLGTTRGSVMYRGASSWASAGPGTAGYVWTTGGVGADPSWQAGGGGGGGSSYIKPEDYGAVGNGTTNDTVALQAFLDACANNIGQFTPGKTYGFNGRLLVRSNSYLIGYGATLKAITAAPMNCSSLCLTDATQGTAPGPTNVTIVGLTVNGNATARRTAGSFSGVGNAASFYCMGVSHVHFRDCKAIDSEGDGFYMGGISGTSGNSYYFSYENCYANGSSRNGFSCVGSNYGTYRGCTAENINYGQTQGNISYGWDFEPDSPSSNNNGVEVIGCHAISCTTTGFGVNTNAGGLNYALTWIGCYAQACGTGFYANAVSVQLKLIGCRNLSNTTNFFNCAESARTTLIANTTFYVRSDGSNSNDGMSNSAGGAFLTIQKALDVAGTIDTNTFQITIQVQNGTWTENLVFYSVLGGGTVLLRGDPTTPTNVVLQSTTGTVITINGAVGKIQLSGFRSVTSGGGSYHIRVTGAGTNVELGTWNFGASAAGHININTNAYIFSSTNYTISGSASLHVAAGQAAVVSFNTPTVTLTGTPAFGTFAVADGTALLYYGGTTFSGSATGTRYAVTYNAIIGTYGGTLPGNAAGSATTGGQYF